MIQHDRSDRHHGQNRHFHAQYCHAMLVEQAHERMLRPNRPRAASNPRFARSISIPYAQAVIVNATPSDDA